MGFAPLVSLVPLMGALALIASGASVSPAGEYAETNGIRMYYEVHGRGAPLILLHGGAGNGMQFSHQVPFFERSCRVIVPDVCAQGRSTDRAGALTYHAMAEDVIALMDHLHVRTADVMGWSDGGVVGLDIAIHHPERIRHLFTLGANFSPDGMNAPDVAWIDTATVSAFGDDMRKGWQSLSPEPEHYEAAMAKIITLWRTEPNFTPAQLHSIRARVVIGAGEHDVVRPEHSAALAKAIPGARLWVVPGASHSVMMEKPDLVNRAVLDFILHDRAPGVP